jgi:hypothetical protein
MTRLRLRTAQLRRRLPWQYLGTRAGPPLLSQRALGRFRRPSEASLAAEVCGRGLLSRSRRDAVGYRRASTDTGSPSWFGNLRLGNLGLGNLRNLQ